MLSLLHSKFINRTLNQKKSHPKSSIQSVEVWTEINDLDTHQLQAKQTKGGKDWTKKMDLQNPFTSFFASFLYLDDYFSEGKCLQSKSKCKLKLSR